MWVSASDLCTVIALFFLCVIVPFLMVKSRLAKRWTPARAAELEGILSALLRKVTDGQATFLETSGCSYKKFRDYKIAFSDKQESRHFMMSYNPADGELICMTTGFSWEFPQEILRALRKIFPKAKYYTKSEGFSVRYDPKHYLAGISERALRRALNK